MEADTADDAAMEDQPDSLQPKEEEEGKDGAETAAALETTMHDKAVRPVTALKSGAPEMQGTPKGRVASLVSHHISALWCTCWCPSTLSSLSSTTTLPWPRISTGLDTITVSIMSHYLL